MVHPLVHEFFPGYNILHASFARLHSDEWSLAIARVGLLEVYDLVRSSASRDVASVRLVASLPLVEEPKDLQRLPVRGPSARALTRSYKADLLVISYSGGRIAILAFDPFSYRIVTATNVGLTALAKQDLDEKEATTAGGGLFIPSRQLGYSGTGRVALDPRGRCIASVVADNCIVLLPLRSGRGALSAMLDMDVPSLSSSSSSAASGAGAGGVAGPSGSGSWASLEGPGAADTCLGKLVPAPSAGDLRGRKRRRAEAEEDPSGTGGSALRGPGARVAVVRRAYTSMGTGVPSLYHVLGPPSALAEDILAALARPPVVARLPSLLRGCNGPVIDVCCLAGYVHPTLLVLLDSPIGPSSAGRVTAIRANRQVAALQLSGHGASQGLSLMWTVDGLPHDASRVAACPQGGALVISSSSVAYVSDTRKCAAAVNGHGQALLDPSKIATDSSFASLAAVIEAPRFEWVSASSMLLASRRGDALLVQLYTDGPSRVNGISVSKAGIVASAPSCLCTLWDAGVAFYGSAVGDSYLLRLGDKPGSSDRSKAESSLVDGPAEGSLTAVKSDLALAPTGGGGVPGLTSTDDEAAFLFGTSSSSTGASSSSSSGGGGDDDGSKGSESLQVTVIATLPGVGPITSAGLSLVQRGSGSEEPLALQPRQQYVIASAGYARGGAILSVRQGLDVRHEVGLEMGGVSGMWSIRVSRAFRKRKAAVAGSGDGGLAAKGVDGSSGYSKDEAADSGDEEAYSPVGEDEGDGHAAAAAPYAEREPEEPGSDDDESEDEEDDEDDFLVMSLPLRQRSRVMALQGTAGLEELPTDSSPFAHARHTITAGTLAGGDVAVQVVPDGVRVLWGMHESCRCSLRAGDVAPSVGKSQRGHSASLVRGDVQGNSATVLASDGKWYLIRALCAETASSAGTAKPSFTTKAPNDVPTPVVEGLSAGSSFRCAQQAAGGGEYESDDDEDDAVEAVRPDRVLQARSGKTAVFLGIWCVSDAVPQLPARGCVSLRAVADESGRLARALMRDPTEAARRLYLGRYGGLEVALGATGTDTAQFDADASLAKQLATTDSATAAVALPGLDGGTEGLPSGSIPPSTAGADSAGALPGLDEASDSLPGLDGEDVPLGGAPVAAAGVEGAVAGRKRGREEMSDATGTGGLSPSRRQSTPGGSTVVGPVEVAPCWKAGGCMLLAACADGTLVVLDCRSMAEVAMFERAADLPSVLAAGRGFDAEGAATGVRRAVEVEGPVLDSAGAVDVDMLCAPLDDAFVVEVEDSAVRAECERVAEAARAAEESGGEASAAEDDSDDEDEDEEDQASKSLFLVLLSGGCDVAAYRLVESYAAADGSGGAYLQREAVGAVASAPDVAYVLVRSKAACSGAAVQPWAWRSVVTAQEGMEAAVAGSLGPEDVCGAVARHDLGSVPRFVRSSTASTRPAADEAAHARARARAAAVGAARLAWINAAEREGNSQAGAGGDDGAAALEGALQDGVEGRFLAEGASAAMEGEGGDAGYPGKGSDRVTPARLDTLSLLEPGPYPRIIPMPDAGGWSGAAVITARPVAVVSSRGMPVVTPLRPPPHLPESMQPSQFAKGETNTGVVSYKHKRFPSSGAGRPHRHGRKERVSLVVTGTNDSPSKKAAKPEKEAPRDNTKSYQGPTDHLDTPLRSKAPSTFGEAEKSSLAITKSGIASTLTIDPRDAAAKSVGSWGALPVGVRPEASVAGAAPWPLLAVARVCSPYLPDGIAVSLTHCPRVVLGTPLQREEVPPAAEDDKEGVVDDAASHEDGGGWFVAAGSACLVRRQPVRCTPRYVVPLRRAELIGDPANQLPLARGMHPQLAMAMAQRAPRRLVPLAAAVLEDESPRVSSAAEEAEEEQRKAAIGEEYRQRDEGPHREALPVPDDSLAQPAVVQQRIVLLVGSRFVEVQSTPLRKHERVLCCKELGLPLAPQGAEDSVLAVGTGMLTPRAAEEYPRGRLLLFRVSYPPVQSPSEEGKSGAGEASSELGAAFGSGSGAGAGAASGAGAGGELPAPRRPQLQLVAQQELNGHVTAVTDVVKQHPSRPNAPPLPPSYFVVAHSAAHVATYLWMHGQGLKQTDKRPMRWMARDIVNLRPKPFLLLADGRQSITFADVSATIDPYTGGLASAFVRMLASDTEHVSCQSAGYLAFGSALRMVALDTEGNAFVQRYDPSKAKTVLFRAADARLPGTVRGATQIEPLPVYNGRLLSAYAAVQGKRYRIGMLLPSASGALGALVPVDPAAHRRLAVLQTLVYYVLPAPAGGNATAGATAASDYRPRMPVFGGVLDGRQLWRLAGLPGPCRQDACLALGTTEPRVLGNLQDLEAALGLF